MDDFKKYWEFPLFALSDGPQITVGQIVMTVLVIFLGIFFSWYLQRLLGRRLKKSGVNPNVTQTVQRIVFSGILLLLFITVLGMLRIPVTALAFVSGAVAIGVGFGAQNIINNLISSWILLSERPVRIGDFVEVDSHRGVIEGIGHRSTRIKRVDGVHLMVPNSQMLERVVINWTLIDNNFRTSVRVGVNYGSPVRLVEKLLYQAADEHPFVLKEPRILVIFEDYGDNALIFDVLFWCQGMGEKELRTIRSDVRFRIEELFSENGIVIAFPQRDIHLYAKTPIEVTTRQS